jgi:hypothetical protein
MLDFKLLRKRDWAKVAAFMALGSIAVALGLYWLAGH